MKLSVKISAAAVSLLLFLSQLFSVWNLWETGRQIMENTISLEWEKLVQDGKEFEKQWTENRIYLKNQNLEKLWAMEVFRSICKKKSVLYYQGEELFNMTPYVFNVEGKVSSFGKRFDPVIGSTSSKQSCLFLEKMGEKHLLICYWESSDKDFCILRYRDISEIYADARWLFWRGILVSLVLALILTGSITLILKKILSPFYRLRDAANVIADGNYEERVVCMSTDEVGEVAESFNRMADRVQEHVYALSEANEKQRQLLGALSHELKTPMTAIQGYAELLQKVELPPARRTNALAYIEEECKRLSRLSVKMLQIVELSGEEKIERQTILLADLFEKAEKITRHRLLAKHLSLKTEREVSKMEGDGDLLLSFITNLIENAVRASREGSTIWLAATQKGIFVRDEGCGIPEEEIRRIAEPFYMVDKSRSRKEGGAGLGLALCSQIARLHGGTLTIESTPGKGSTIGFTVCLHSGEDMAIT